MNSTNPLLRSLSLAVICILTGTLFLVSCKKDDDTTAPVPGLAITSVNPTSGKAGDIITITGTGFNTTPASNTVLFGTAAATVINSASTLLTVSVPGGITGSVPVKVSLPGSLSAASATPFNVTTTLTKPVVTITSAITANQSWTADNIYLLTNFVYVRSGVTVTIAPGTIIKGDKLSKGTLIFEPGSKIMAQGTATNPIIFTSNLAPGLRNLGDWGGLVITGKADDNAATGITDPTALPVVEGGPTTQVSAIDGQRNNADNSGILSYVRIEWAGVALSPNNEINGLSLYAVGSGTQIDHVQVSFANDDAIESFGGVQNMSYLIAYRAIDDDFDTDNGYSGNVQFGLSVRDLTIADQSGSKSFESDNDANNSTKLPQTSVVYSNMTLIGPSAVTTAGASMSTTANPANAAASANYVSAMHIRRNSALSVFNSIEMGWPAGLLLDGTNVATNIASGKSVIANNILGGNLVGTVNGVASYNRDVLYISGSGGAGSLTPINALGPDSTAFGTAVGPVTYLRANGNRRFAGTAAILLTNPFTASGTKPDLTPAAGSPALTGAAFTNAKLAPAFFDKTPVFVGAVSTDKNYTSEQWVNFDPQNAVYQ